ncbi:glycoside hydrolase family 47 protein [Xylaria nigripes]|nr:glycoside hydrolase family 47 protein [Xylaria nigripes]
MFRLRKYRYYVFFAAIVVFLLYRVVQNSDEWETVSASIPHTGPSSKLRPPPASNIVADHRADAFIENFSTEDDDLPRKILDNTGKENPIKDPDVATAQRAGTGHDDEVPLDSPTNLNVPDRKVGDGAHGAESQPGKVAITATHWEKVPENFPVPNSDIIPLPAGKPKTIPTIQYAFEKESRKVKEIREARQQLVKAEMKRSWAGYWKYAKGHDELSPVTGKFRDPFCGWAATLVDSLDTLWIMGMKDEFEEALVEVEKIDFTIGKRSEIPVFETTIRYLGGLVAAYDISGGHDGGYKILLKKARELAEILMGAFDTPNRMPLLYYNWNPHFASQPKRASSRAGVAELGSLAMEFTRLAQITNENRYYDAVARITNAFYEWQERGTSIPGIFPENVDTTGCNRTAQNELEAARSAAEFEAYDETEDDIFEDSDKIERSAKESILPECVSQGLTSASWGVEQYSMGGSQDSTYEYFPKQWLLLGGLEPKYKELHLKVTEAVKKWLLYRPMVPDDRDALFSAKITTRGEPETDANMQYEVTHLTCFIGGMFGMSGKIFERPGDVEIGKKLTEGCVWAYESTPTGIMPEGALVLPCQDANDCHWNMTRYMQNLDPSYEIRALRIKEYDEKKAKAKASREEGNKSARHLTSSANKAGNANDDDTEVQRSDLEDDESPILGQKTEVSRSLASDLHDSDPAPGFTRSHNHQAPLHEDEDMVEEDPLRPLSHEEFVTQKMQNENLPLGFVDVNSKAYILRPEAIESVWYMYRITGDKHWQEKGWKMFEAIVRYTTTEIGNSAITSVLAKDTTQLNEMESFWTAETLKYFYLLYSEPNVVSLDDWVLNTEAHPFKRPKTSFDI